MNKIVLLVLALFAATTVWGQGLIINGNIVIEESSTEGTKVVIYKNSNKLDEQVITKKGRFDLKLAFDGDYKISFEKSGYITKAVSINTEVPSEIIESRPDFPPVRLIINLLPTVEGVDLSIFEQPIAILNYDYELDDFAFDKEYSNSIKESVAKAEKEVRNTIARKGAAALEKERLFAEFMAKGENGYTQKQWQPAIDNWTKALSIKPETKELPEKIELAKKELERELAAQSIAAQNEKAYQLLIASADSLFNLKQYAESRNRYTDATKIKANEAYPVKRINEINILLEKLALEQKEADAQKALAEKYKNLIALADEQFNQKNYDGAEPKYREALALNYEKVYPEQQLKNIADIRKLESDRQKQEATVAANYNRIIAAADNSFNAKDYTNAIKSYNQALEVKPAEAYPKEMIVKSNEALVLLQQQQAADAERKRQEEAKKAELMNSYNKLIAEADGAFKAENYAQARLKYTDADKLNTGEVYPKNKLKEIDNIFNSAKYQNRLAEYNKNKTAGDKALESKSYASAKVYYQRAIEILPIDSELIRERLENIEKLIKDEQLAAIMKEYNEHISKADKAYKEKSYAVAKFYYQKALGVKKDDKYAAGQLAEVEKYISERTEKTVEL